MKMIFMSDFSLGYDRMKSVDSQVFIFVKYSKHSTELWLYLKGITQKESFVFFEGYFWV